MNQRTESKLVGLGSELDQQYQEAVKKLDQLHKEAQILTNPTERHPRYTEPSLETENINNNYKEMQNEIENFYKDTLKKKVQKDEEMFLEHFTNLLSELHS